VTNGADGHQTDTTGARERRRAREALLADRAAAARVRAQRRVGLRPPSALPVAQRSGRGLVAPDRLTA
jgi:hypothetical protein